VLRELRIENLLLIEKAELRLGQGLNAITGETGAGKTVLAHSLDLLMGGKARPQIVRPGAEEAWVEGVFDLPDGMLEEPELAELAERLPDGAEEIVLGRRVSASGRTGAFVAGRAASAADLKLLGGRLLAFYGQHEHRKLTLSSAQMEVLDGFAGASHLEIRRRYREAHRECARLEAELNELRERDGSRERDLDLYRHELSEIEAVAPDPAEATELAGERERLRHAEGLREAAGGALTGVSGTEENGGAVAALAQAEALLQKVGDLDPELDEVGQRLSAFAIELGDIAAELRVYLEGVESDPERLAAVEERLDLLDRLERKHGGSIESVLAHAERCRAEIERLEGGEERDGELAAALAEATARREKLGEQLSTGRAKAAGPLEKKVAMELEQLAMPGATLEVALAPNTEGFGPNGKETIELRVAPNSGIDPAPLRDAASGGELSRVMLALTGLGDGGGPGTLVFDEIDAGIGGTTARVVGERLRALGDGRQVICITHLPQVASLAGTHFRLEKDLGGDPATATVERLDGEGIVEEIRRMLGGGDSDEGATRHARELLKAA
jgi:DNA repair protein RecN (Recombination protein N)